MDPTVDWVPVAGLLEAASQELEVGQLLHTSVFSLFEAMSAVEIGNPKMDAGARPKGDSTPLSVRPLHLDLSPQQLLAVIDHLMCLEATWHNGGAAARTIYSSLYMMQPDRTAVNSTLSAFCRGLEATCAEVNHLVMTGCVCEEEDFNAHIAGLPLEHATTAAGASATGLTPQHTPAMPAAVHSSSSGSSGGGSSKKGSTAAATAAAAEHTDKVLAALSRAIDGQDLSMKQWQQQQQGGSSGAAATAALAAAIVGRLQFRKQLLQGLIKLKRRQKQDLDQAAKLFLKAQAELSGIRSSLELSGLSGPSGSPQDLCWDETMNHHLVPAVPPRNIKVFSPADAVDYFDRLLGQLIKVCGITHVHSYSGLKDFITGFMGNGGQGGFSVCPVARSALHIQVSYTAWVPPPPPSQQQQQQPPQQQQQQQESSSSSTAATAAGAAAADQLHHSHIQQPHTAPVSHSQDPPAAAAAAGSTAAQPPQPPLAAAAAASGGDVVVPVWCLSPRMLRAALLISPDAALGDDGDLFIEQAVIATGNLVQALLMNPSRCRRRLRRGLEDWSNLYQHALNADLSPAWREYMEAHAWNWKQEHPDDIVGPLSTWVECETSAVMVRHLLMGFELQLYEQRDYGMIYWYCDALLSVVQQATKLLNTHKPAVITTAAAAAKPGSSGSSTSAANGPTASPRLPSKGSKASKGSSPSSSSGGGSSSGSTAAAAAATAAALQAYQQQATLTGVFVEVYKLLAMGTLRVLLTLPMLGMFQPPELLFNSQAQRYDQRFASFHVLQRPDPLSFDQYVAATDVSGAVPEQLLRLAFDNFSKAHQACTFIKQQGAAWGLTKQQAEELPQLDRVAATNNVAVALLSRTAAAAATTSSSSSKEAAGNGAGASAGAAAAAAAAKPQFMPFWEFGHHKWFPTLVLKSAAATAAGAKQQK